MTRSRRRPHDARLRPGPHATGPPTRFEPSTANAPDAVSDPDTAVTVTVDPGLAHGVPRFICVTAVPEAFVVADTGVNVAPVGPENDTAGPTIG